MLHGRRPSVRDLPNAGDRSEDPVLIATSCGATRQIRTPPGLTVVLRSSNPGLQMSAMGQSRHVGFGFGVPLYPRTRPHRRVLLSDATGQWRHRPAYSITSPASARSVGGTVKPSALAVFKLITKSYLVGCKTGRSAGFSPLRIRPT